MYPPDWAITLPDQSMDHVHYCITWIILCETDTTHASVLAINDVTGGIMDFMQRQIKSQCYVGYTIQKVFFLL